MSHPTGVDAQRRRFLGRLGLSLVGAFAATGTLSLAGSPRTGASLPPAFPKWDAAPARAPEARR